MSWKRRRDFGGGGSAPSVCPTPVRPTPGFSVPDLMRDDGVHLLCRCDPKSDGRQGVASMQPVSLASDWAAEQIFLSVTPEL